MDSRLHDEWPCPDYCLLIIVHCSATINLIPYTLNLKPFFIMPTKRQEIIKLLSNRTCSLQELSFELHISMKEVLNHLEHVRKSVRAPRAFLIDPAECLDCGFVFKDRSKIHKPGKCPRCRGTHIKEPFYWIE